MEEKKKLVEYWSDRREWVNPETGEVLGQATSAKAEVLARMSQEDAAGAGGKRVTTAALLAPDDQGPDGAAAQVLVTGHGEASPAGDISREILETPAVLVPTHVDDVASAYYLWVDPRREAGYRPATFDQAAFLERAIALFRSKDRWGGRRPEVVRVHPELVGNGLGPVTLDDDMASVLGLTVVGDPTVATGTYQLGLGSDRRSHEPLPST